jgi:hypothetical protein
MPSSQKFKIRIEGLPRRKHMVFLGHAVLADIMKGRERVLGVKGGVVRAGHTRPGQIWSWGKLNCIDGDVLYCTVRPPYDPMITT